MEDDENLGGGSGGAAMPSAIPDCEEEDKGHQTISVDGTYSIRANQVALTSWKNIPPSADNESRIMLLAMGGLTGAFMDDGTVDVRGCKGVRITSGPLLPPVLNPPMSADSTDGVEIEAGETQSITIKRGMLPVIDQYISLTPSGITINAGIGGTLTLNAGLSQITIGPAGITIIGMPLVQINPGAPAPPPPPPLPPDEPVLGDFPDPTPGLA
jgi:hypothetical protein